MNAKLLEHIEKALTEFTGKEFFDELVQAKLEYSRLTGPIDEDDEDYEARMDTFNVWYLFDYSPRGEKTAMERYVELHSLGEEEGAFLLSQVSSVFEFGGESLRKRLVLKDLLHKNKVTLTKNHPHPGLLKGDLFIGKVFTQGEERFLLPVYCVLPEDSLYPMNKRMKQMRKQMGENRDLVLERDFLLKTMHLKNRHRRFSHVNPKVFFKYE